MQFSPQICSFNKGGGGGGALKFLTTQDDFSNYWLCSVADLQIVAILSGRLRMSACEIVRHFSHKNPCVYQHTINWLPKCSLVLSRTRPGSIMVSTFYFSRKMSGSIPARAIQSFFLIWFFFWKINSGVYGKIEMLYTSPHYCFSLTCNLLTLTHTIYISICRSTMNAVWRGTLCVTVLLIHLPVSCSGGNNIRNLATLIVRDHSPAQHSVKALYK